MTDPEPCPFCLWPQPHIAGELDKVFIKCTACGARGPEINIAGTTTKQAAEMATHEWNTRCVRR